MAYKLYSNVETDHLFARTEGWQIVLTDRFRVVYVI